ncbi:hypothetical protein F2P58_23310 [Vibrio fortis]|uniref:Uncharacterized protein n=1 Tax=Vibrio fortis TaxID=212667 RepID=A0A5N3QTC9_9VIBR|nr:hypothetical protein [Vibrio fortis]KAB0285446.1 hypothetical protein F2P58_23310 [Vibrio fortis]
MIKQEKLWRELARTFGARKAKRLFKRLPEEALTNSTLSGAFVWTYSNDGHDFWCEIDRKVTQAAFRYNFNF